MDEAEEFSLVCQPSEVEANPGDDVVLSCRLEPAISAASMEIKWWHKDNLVCHYKYGRVKYNRDYERRVHFPLDLKKGNLSLKMRDVRRSQSGFYTCEVIHEQQVKKEYINLRVKPVNFKLVVPNPIVYANQGENVDLRVQFSPANNATSLTIKWLKERVFIYEYVDGKEAKHRHYASRVSLNIQELERGNIFLTLENVKWSDSGNYTCQVNSEEYNVEKKIELHVRDEMRWMSDGVLKKHMKKETLNNKLKKLLSEIDLPSFEFLEEAELEVEKYREFAPLLLQQSHKSHLRTLRLLRQYQQLRQPLRWRRESSLELSEPIRSYQPFQPCQQSLLPLLLQTPQETLVVTFQDIILLSPQNLLVLRDNDDDMDNERNKNTLFLFDPRPALMEIISSIMFDEYTNSPERQEVVEETEQRVFDEYTNSPERQEVVEETEQRGALNEGLTGVEQHEVEEESSIENTEQSREEIASDQEIPSTALQQDEKQPKKKRKWTSCVLL